MQSRQLLAGKAWFVNQCCKWQLHSDARNEACQLQKTESETERYSQKNSLRVSRRSSAKFKFKFSLGRSWSGSMSSCRVSATTPRGLRANTTALGAILRSGLFYNLRAWNWLMMLASASMRCLNLSTSPGMENSS